MPTMLGHRRYLLPCVVVLLTGCGADTYRSRLKETAAYFSYQQELREELGPTRTQQGVSLQAPRQFGWIEPPPPPEVDDTGEVVAAEATEDPRQPHYLGITFPGLLGAWEATVQAEVAGQDEPRTAYLYLLGNHDRHLQSSHGEGLTEEPQTYLTDLENLLSGTIGVVLPEGETGTGVEKNQRYRETAPRVEPNVKFTPRKDFTAVTLSPQIDVGDLDLPFEMQLYEWAGQQIQVAVLMVYPQSVSPRENLHDRLLLSLETLSISDAPPTASSRSEGAPSGGTGIAF